MNIIEKTKPAKKSNTGDVNQAARLRAESRVAGGSTSYAKGYTGIKWNSQKGTP